MNRFGDAIVVMSIIVGGAGIYNQTQEILVYTKSELRATDRGYEDIR